MDAFTTSMRKHWRTLCFIDLFAGAGIEQYKDNKELGWGSPLLAAQTRFPFTQIHCCEMKPRKHAALRSRLAEFFPEQHANCHLGDANEVVQQICDNLDPQALNLAFLDPYGLHLHLATIETLSRTRADLIIFFPDHLDARRNWAQYKDDRDSNLDRVLGSDADWRSIFSEQPAHLWIESLREMYERQIRRLGFSYFEYERISVGSHPLYRLIFCSKHPKGAEIWRNTSQKKVDNQQTWQW